MGDGNLNFATGAIPSEDDADYVGSGYLKKGKISRQDPMSHRIIEKRRRDRMNNCLADLSRLIPPDYLKKGRGRVEKTEIIEMAIRHLKYLQDRSSERQDCTPISAEHFHLGYQECLSEVMRQLVERQVLPPADPLSVQLVAHLQRHCDNIMKGDQLNKRHSNPETTSTSSGSTINYMTSPSVTAAHRTSAECREEGAGSCHYKAAESERYRRPADAPLEAQPLDLADVTQPASVPSQASQMIRWFDSTREENGYDDKEPYSRVEHDSFATGDKSDRRTDGNHVSRQYTRRHLSRHEPNLRNVRKQETCPAQYPMDCNSNVIPTNDGEILHSYKFKNTFKQRFSESQNGIRNIMVRGDGGDTIRMGQPTCRRDQNGVGSGRYYKRRRLIVIKNSSGERDERISPTDTSSDNVAQSSVQSSKSFSGEGDDTTVDLAISSDNMLKWNQDVEACKSTHPIDASKYYKSDEQDVTKLSNICVPIFALNTLGKFYVPLNVDYDCLAPFLGPYDLLDPRNVHVTSPLHPVSINVNFQPYFQNLKPKTEQEWQR